MNAPVFNRDGVAITPNTRPVGEGALRVPQLLRNKLIERPGVEEGLRPVGRPIRIALLIQKLFLEVAEIADDITDPAEYADVMQVLMDLATEAGVSLDDIIAAGQKKAAEKGTFADSQLWLDNRIMGKSA